MNKLHGKKIPETAVLGSLCTFKNLNSGVLRYSTSDMQRSLEGEMKKLPPEIFPECSLNKNHVYRERPCSQWFKDSHSKESCYTSFLPPKQKGGILKLNNVSFIFLIIYQWGFSIKTLDLRKTTGL